MPSRTDIDNTCLVLDPIPLSRYHCMLLFIHHRLLPLRLLGSGLRKLFIFFGGARSWKLRHCFGAFASRPCDRRQGNGR